MTRLKESHVSTSVMLSRDPSDFSLCRRRGEPGGAHDVQLLGGGKHAPDGASLRRPLRTGSQDTHSFGICTIIFCSLMWPTHVTLILTVYLKACKQLRLKFMLAVNNYFILYTISLQVVVFHQGNGREP